MARLLLPVVFAVQLCADALPCDLRAYRPMPGLNASIDDDVLTLTWDGERSEAVRLRFTNAGGSPMIQEMAVRPTGGMWTALATNVRPEFSVTTPGTESVPAVYDLRGCEVKTDGSRLEASFGGVNLGTIGGHLRFTVYRGTNLIREEFVPETNRNRAAGVEYDAGLRGLPIRDGSKLMWRDQDSAWQQSALDGAASDTAVMLRPPHRQLIAQQGKAGSISIFAPPHGKFEGVWYRKDSWRSFSAGIRAVYSAQSDAIYFYPDAIDGQATADAVLAFTRGDQYKKMPGYQIVANPGDPAAVDYVKADGDISYRDAVPVRDALRRGAYFTTTGEVLIHSAAVEGQGENRTLVIDLEWTFPLNSIELSAEGGAKMDRRVVSATGMPAFGDYMFRVPFNAAGNTLLRVSAIDSAGDSAAQAPIQLIAGALQ